MTVSAVVLILTMGDLRRPGDAGSVFFISTIGNQCTCAHTDTIVIGSTLVMPVTPSAVAVAVAAVVAAALAAAAVAVAALVVVVYLMSLQQMAWRPTMRALGEALESLEASA
jgi:hypothetical protein